ncbi:hypothetical protein T4C_2043, partial [Trichinella pseudospiralis]
LSAMENGMNLKVQFYNELLAVIEFQIRQTAYVGVALALKNGNQPFALNEKEFEVLKEHMQQFYREGPYKVDAVSGVVSRCVDYQAEEIWRDKINQNKALPAAGQLSALKSKGLCNRLQRVRRCMSRRQILCVKCLNKMINSDKDLDTSTNRRASSKKTKNTTPRKKSKKQKKTGIDLPAESLEPPPEVEFTGVTATVTADTITTTTVTTASVVTTVTTTAATATVTTATVVSSDMNAENVEREVSTNEPQPIQTEAEVEIFVDDESCDQVVEKPSEPALLEVVPENPSTPKQSNTEQETFCAQRKSARKSLSGTSEICSELTTKRLEFQTAMEVGQQAEVPEATEVQLNSNDVNRPEEIIEQLSPQDVDVVEQKDDLPSMEVITITDDDRPSTKIILNEKMDIVCNLALNESSGDLPSAEIIVVEKMDTVSNPALNESSGDRSLIEIFFNEKMNTVSIPALNESNGDVALRELVRNTSMNIVSNSNDIKQKDDLLSTELVIAEKRRKVCTPDLEGPCGDLPSTELSGNEKMDIITITDDVEGKDDLPSKELEKIDIVTIPAEIEVVTIPGEIEVVTIPGEIEIVTIPDEPCGDLPSTELSGNEKMDIITITDDVEGKDDLPSKELEKTDNITIPDLDEPCGDLPSAESSGNEKMDMVTSSSAVAVRNEQLTSSRPKRNLKRSHSKLNCPCCTNATAVKEGDLVWVRRCLGEKNRQAYWPAKVLLSLDNASAMVEIFETPPVEECIHVEFIEPFRNSFRKYYNPNKNVKFQNAVAMAILQTDGEIYKDYCEKVSKLCNRIMCDLLRNNPSLASACRR